MQPLVDGREVLLLAPKNLSARGRTVVAAEYRAALADLPPEELALLACNGSRAERRAALRGLRRLATAPTKK